MAYGPCLNPNCKSQGKPHPNCQCYVGMADGGKVKHFCESKQMHQKGCQYYAEGTPEEPVVAQQDLSGQDFDSLPTETSETPADLTGQSFDSLQEDERDHTGADFDSLKDDRVTEYETPGQQILTGVEGAAQGLAGPLATAAELGLSKLGVPGISAEDIKGRQEANPWIHGLSEAGGLGASLLTPIGQGSVAAKAATALAGKGSRFIQAALANMAIAGGDEMSKAMLGQENQEHPVASVLANVGAAGLLGGIFQGSIGKLKDLNLGSKAMSYLSGIGAGASGSALEETARGVALIEKKLFDQKMFDLGQKTYDKALKGIKWSVASGIADQLAGAVGNHAYWATPYIAKQLEAPLGKMGKYTVPVVMKWLSEGAPSELAPLLNYSAKASSGQNLLNSSVNGLFKEGYLQGNEALDKSHIVDRLMNELDEWIKNGGIDKDIQDEVENQASPMEQFHPGFAEGGEVKAQAEQPRKGGIFHDHPIAEAYPQQNMLLMAAKGRISNYLKSLRPQDNAPKLAFDTNPDQTAQKRSYKKALRIAASPLSIMQKASQGTLDPEDMKHFNSLYPEVGQVLAKKLTEKITDAQLKGEKPSYKMRQSMSLLMGAPLSSDLTPHNIMAAQSVFSQASQPTGPAQPGGVKKNKKNTSSLTKFSQAYLTGNQSSALRMQQV